jgi:hypothetical protein
MLGIFFLLFGICILLVGGGCTILWIMMLGSSASSLSELGLLLLSVGAAAAGIFSIIFAFRLFRGTPASSPPGDPYEMPPPVDPIGAPPPGDSDGVR